MNLASLYYIFFSQYGHVVFNLNFFSFWIFFLLHCITCLFKRIQLESRRSNQPKSTLKVIKCKKRERVSVKDEGATLLCGAYSCHNSWDTLFHITFSASQHLLQIHSNHPHYFSFHPKIIHVMYIKFLNMRDFYHCVIWQGNATGENTEYDAIWALNRKNKDTYI